MTITARFASKCSVCGKRIPVGTTIEWSRDGGARHERCEAPTDIRVEFPSRGATYCRQAYGVYKYDAYPDNSVLAGRVRRTLLDSFATLAEARAAYPDAVEAGCGYEKMNLHDLPDEDGHTGGAFDDGFGGGW